MIKDNGAIVLTASQPFTSALVMSNPKMFKHAWVWHKKNAGNMLVAKFQPLKTTEDILVFSRGGERVNYFPIYTEGAKDRSRESPQKKKTSLYGSIKSGEFRHGDNKKGSQRYPKHLIEFSNANHRNKYHSTQKPVALFEYLIKTYTNEGDLVLDNVAGSGTTGVACQNLNRDFILIEKEPEYVEIIKQRLRQ